MFQGPLHSSGKGEAVVVAAIKKTVLASHYGVVRVVADIKRICHHHGHSGCSLQGSWARSLPFPLPFPKFGLIF